MSMHSLHCPVTRHAVLVANDLSGRVGYVICEHLDKQTYACRIKVEAREQPPLNRLVARAAQHALGSHDDHCDLLQPM